MAATLNALEFVEACKEFVGKYSKQEAHGSTPELSILQECNAGWTLIEHPVGTNKSLYTFKRIHPIWHLGLPVSELLDSHSDGFGMVSK